MNGENEQVSWHVIGIIVAIVSAILIPGAAALITWGTITTNLADHEKRITHLEDRDNAARNDSSLVLQRLTGIETKVEVLLGLRRSSEKQP